MTLVRRLWEEDTPFDYSGDFYRIEGAFSSVKPATPGGIPLWFAGASPAAVGVGAACADVYAFWAEPRDAVASRIAEVTAAAEAVGRRPPGFSLSLRPIIADTEDAAWERARWIAERAAERIEEARRRSEAQAGWTGLGSGANRTYSVERDTSITTSVGRRRLIEFADGADVLDERLWMTIARLTGAAGNSTALVGTPEQVADAMERYHEIGIDRFLLRGFDPVEDAADYGRRLLPLVRAKVAERAVAERAVAGRSMVGERSLG
jgi:alkanesulfonate monooxygenase